MMVCRFQLIDEGEGLYKVLDLEYKVSVSFMERKFNSTQKFQFEQTDGLHAEDIARICREIGDFLRNNHYNIAMPPVINHRQRIGECITELRKSQGLTQSQLAELIGSNQGNVARIEAGRYNVTFDILQRIADALGHNIDFVEHR